MSEITKLYRELSEVEEDKFYLFAGQLMTGSQLFALLEAQEPAIDPTSLQIEEVVKLSPEILTRQQPTND